MAGQEIFRVRIRMADYEVEVESTDRKYVDEKVKEHLRANPPTAPAIRPLAASGASRPTSLKEFTARVRPDKKVEIAATIAFYLEYLTEVLVAHWKPEEVASRFTEIRKERPKNMTDLLKSSLYFMPADERGCYKLSETGVEWVRERAEANEG
jgi:hypothetical protein